MEWKHKTQFERIKERWDSVENPYERRRRALEPICDYFRPDLGIDYDEEADMLMLGGDIYEGSGPWVARKASTMFQGNTVSKKNPWFNYEFSDNRLEGIDILDTHTKESSEHIADVYQRGNFYNTQAQFTLDGWTTGSPLSFIEEDPDTGNVMFIPSHWLSYRIFYNRFNRSYGVIIKDKNWTVGQCFEKFCPGNNINERLKKAEKIFTKALYDNIRNGMLNEHVTIWRAVFRKKDPIWMGDDNNTDDFKPPIGKEWYDVYYEDTVLKERQDSPLLTAGYYSKPYVHWDYEKKVWESSSRTPAFYAIYDNVTMQQVFKNYIENMQLKVRPAMAVLMGMEGRQDYSSEGLNYYNKAEWNYRPEPINQVGDINFETETVDRFLNNLTRHFHLDELQLFTNLAMEKNKDFRVLQLMEMRSEKITLLLPMMDTHEFYLSSVDARVREIETRAGRGPFNKANLENIDAALEYYLGEDASKTNMQPEFVGTMRKEQQRYQRLKPLMDGVTAISELADRMGDENLMRFALKSFQTVEELARAVDFPAELLNEPEEYIRLVEENNELDAQREQFAMAMEMMKNSKGMPAGETAGALTGETV